MRRIRKPVLRAQNFDFPDFALPGKSAFEGSTFHTLAGARADEGGAMHSRGDSC
jgi:hypothetical protein